MITELPIQIQSIPPQPSYVEIRPYDPKQNIVCADTSESLPRRTLPDPEHFGGYLTPSGGTSQVSLANGTTYQKIEYSWTFWEGPIAEVLIQRDHEGHLLEITPELTSRKV